MRTKVLVVFAVAFRAAPLAASTTEAESAVFAFDTRDSTGTTEAESGVFGMDARNLGNSDSRASGTFALNTLGSAPTGLEIVGPATVTAGSRTGYQVRWHAGNSTLDVTAAARWRFLTGAPGNTGMVPPTFHAGETTVPASTTIVASYIGPTGTGLESPPFTITILPRIQVTLAANPVAGQHGVRQFQAGVAGASGATVVNWDLDGDGQFDDATGESVTRDYGTWTGTTTVKVEVIDGEGERRIEERSVVLNKPPAANQPVESAPAYDPGGFDLYLPDAARSEFVFNAGGLNRRDSGLVVIAHGLKSDTHAGWMLKMGQGIESRCTEDGITPPDIGLLDWAHLAKDPAELPAIQKDLLERLIKQWWNPIGSGTAALGYAADFLIDLAAVKSFGMTTGQQLANWIYQNSSLGATPQIDKNKPIHLIGHSAGGFVAGEAARILKHPNTGTSQVWVDRVTMLDTPVVEGSHILQGGDNLPNPGWVDRYVSSAYGAITWPWTAVAAVMPNAYYRRSDVPKSGKLSTHALDPGSNGHGYAHDWYTDETILGNEFDGFIFSPIIDADSRIAKPVLVPAPAPQNDPPQDPPAEPPDFIPTGWQAFGDAVESGGTWTLTESADAGMWSEFTLPVGSRMLAFEFHFSGAGDGDFLAVHFGDLPVLFRGLDLPLSRDAWLPVEVPLEILPVMAGKLVFTLVSRGAVNAQAQLRNIRISQSTDPDGDGQADDFELRAGTDPRQNGSWFRVVAVERGPGGGITVRWPAAVGRTYSVLHSVDLGTGNLEVLATGLAGGGPLLEFHDASPPAGRAFYWVEFE